MNQPPFRMKLDVATPEPSTCEWCREAKPTARRSFGPSKNMPGQDAVLRLCGPCALRVDNMKADSEKSRAEERARKRVYGR